MQCLTPFNKSMMDLYKCIFSIIKHNIQHNVDNIIKHSLIYITTNNTNKMEKRINKKRGCLVKVSQKVHFTSISVRSIWHSKMYEFIYLFKTRKSENNKVVHFRHSTLWPPNNFLVCYKDKMAASLQRIGIVICRSFPVILQRNLQRQVGWIK